MGGKGSGRREKPLIEVITELQEEIREVEHDVLALHKKIDRLASRWLYWLKKQKKEEYRRKIREAGKK